MPDPVTSRWLTDWSPGLGATSQPSSAACLSCRPFTAGRTPSRRSDGWRRVTRTWGRVTQHRHSRSRSGQSLAQIAVRRRQRVFPSLSLSLSWPWAVVIGTSVAKRQSRAALCLVGQRCPGRGFASRTLHQPRCPGAEPHRADRENRYAVYPVGNRARPCGAKLFTVSGRHLDEVASVGDGRQVAARAAGVFLDLLDGSRSDEDEDGVEPYDLFAAEPRETLYGNATALPPAYCKAYPPPTGTDQASSASSTTVSNQVLRSHATDTFLTTTAPPHPRANN